LRAVVDTAALKHNLQRIRELAPGSRVLAVVKANAYGHGLHIVAQALADADGFAVARIGEALALREAGCRARIMLLQGVGDAAGLETAARHGFEPFVHLASQVALIESYRGPQVLRVWLKIDTGMHRLGFAPAGLLPGAGWKFDRWLDVVLMQRALGPGATTPPQGP